MYHQETLGDRLNYLRLKEDQTLNEIAALLKLSPADISEIEAGRRTITLEQLVTLSSHFHVSTDFLLGMTDIPHMEGGASD